MAQEMACSACGRGMSLQDLDRRTFHEVNGKLYCPECLLKSEQPKKMRCPHCGKETVALLQHGVYICGHCKQSIGGEQQSGVIEAARPSGSRALEPDLPGSRTQSLRARDTSRQQAVALLLGLFVMFTLVLGALLVRDEVNLREIRTTLAGMKEQPAPEPPRVTAPSEASRAVDVKALQKAEKTAKDNPQDYEKGIGAYQEALKTVTDPVLKQKAVDAIELLTVRRENATAQERGEKELEDARAKLTAAAQEIAQLKKTIASAPTVVENKPPVVENKPPVVENKPPELTEAERRATDAAKALEAAQAEAQAQLASRKYGPAMAAFKAVADKYPDLEQGKKADVERQRILSVAWQDFNKMNERATTLIAAKQLDGARELYAEALGFGVPEITRVVEQRRAEIRDTETVPPTTAGGEPALSADVQKALAALRTEKDADRRSEAALSLGSIGAKAAVPDLIKALKDEAWIVRSRSAQSLGKLGDVAAVPALIAALDDFYTVTYDVQRALVALTKQTFGASERAKWSAWYAENKSKLGAGGGAEKPPVVERKPSFNAIVLERRYNPDIVSLALPAGAVVGVGTRVELSRDGAVVCTLSVDQVAKDQAFGKVSDLRAGAKVEAGDTVTVTLPK